MNEFKKCEAHSFKQGDNAYGSEASSWARKITVYDWNFLRKIKLVRT